MRNIEIKAQGKMLLMAIESVVPLIGPKDEGTP